ncbi:unknown protein (plasmid) [Synechocystis sp. PCC 6803]|uniref:Uncharacterized protein n=1 Tax=Synechocystis sp. (strain ATCC 27184 / PCC 6803 / Kazusa) TaxID=1111708 RepID=Q6ZEL7_SYNY3|nr:MULTISPECIES: hypothetical protein [unclassified Synechocystis]AGF53540.1 hypothetical protein MYO_21140 [Synechocystis sp. PCC 6803]AVP91662.1 hypothetical protein C7I86_18035 [Synechocystis sp. IPPAS B-1465]MBD2619806.1 hypothetical protein [Synechocystis sp. FACHB-898]MBD2640866.1 hypothetical protein [Synechocystis sp. FACHB-908]MBD2662503.1 hypothetical protein [Synechocystis sp. FACHB-929]
MSTVTESDLKELKDLIVELKLGQAEMKGQLAGIDNRLIRLETKMETKLDTLEPSIQKIPDLAEKVGELKNWKQIGLTLGGAIIGGIITYLARNANP